MTEWIDNPSYDWIDLPDIAWSAVLGTGFLGFLNQVWSDINYAYAVTINGLVVMDIDTGDELSYINYPEGFSTIWGNDDVIYLGASDGIKYLIKSTILTDSGNPINLEAYINNYEYYSPMFDDVKYIHGHEETLAIVTDYGIEIVDNSLNGFKSYLYSTGIKKCFATSNRSLYYTTTSGVSKVVSWLHDWVSPDDSYVSGASFIDSDLTINDIFATSNTAYSGTSNTLFIATSSGVYILDEDLGTVDHYVNELAGSSINIAAIWADLTTSKDQGKVYIMSSGDGAALSVFNLTTKSLWDYYTTTEAGRAGNTLLAEDAVDMVTGGN